MKKKIISIITLLMLIPTVAYAVPDAPPGGFGGQGGPGDGGGSTNISYSGKTKFTSNMTEDSKSYGSTTGGENALLVSGGTSTISNATITKSGDTSDENSDFYGTNAAVLVYNGATLNINGGTVTTNGGHSNGVFAGTSGTININKTTINTTGNNSGGIMVTGGGVLKATDLTIQTKGNSSAAIRSDRGGGTLTVNGGIYETSGVGSPAIYSTADITVNNATLNSTASEGVVVEGANSVTLNKVKLTDTNNTLNGNSETYKNIFIYQSMSGDASEGTGSFTAKNSTIKTDNGDTFFVTNTNATINLENNTIINKVGDFLRIQTGKWGNSGSNGGNVTLTMKNQKVEGNIIVDNISTLNMSLLNKSVFTGSIDSENQAKNVKLSMSKDSVMILTKDTYLDELSNEQGDNSNIYLNGHKLYVNGKETSANNGKYKNDSATVTKGENKTTNSNFNYLYVVGIIILGLVIGSIAVLIKNYKATK